MLGIDVSDRSVKIAELSDLDNQSLRTVCWSPLPQNLIRRGVVQDPKKVAVVLQEAMQKCSPFPVTDKTIVASIPETQSFVRVLDLPAMPGKEMDEAVRWAVRQHIPFDLDRVYLDWQPLVSSTGREGRLDVLIGAVQKDVVDPLMQVFDILGMSVIALELEAQAIVRSLLPRDPKGVSGVLIVDLGATSTNVILVDRGAMRFTTSIQRGGDDLTQHLAQHLKLQPSIAAEKKALVGITGTSEDDKVASTLREAASDLIFQIEQVVREVTSQFSIVDGVQAVMLAGGASNLPGIKEVFVEVFPGVSVTLGNPWINLSLEQTKNKPPLSSTDAVHFTTAIGLALRRLEYG